MATYHQSPIYLGCLLSYVGYRYFYPAKVWPSFQAIFRTGNLYFRTQKYVVEDESDFQTVTDNAFSDRNSTSTIIKGKSNVATNGKYIPVQSDNKNKTNNGKGNGHINGAGEDNNLGSGDVIDNVVNDPRTPMERHSIVGPSKKSTRMFLFHPHGLLTVGFGLGTSAKFFSKSDTKILITESLTMLPFIGDFVRWNSCYDCSPNAMKKMMKDGENIALIPGGFEETTLYERGKFRIYLKKRKGFIKYALQFGYTLHPIFVFGEEQTYYALSGFTDFRLWINSFKIPAILFMGKYGFLPHSNLDMVTVVGKGIVFPKIEQPTSEDIDKWHTLYISKIEELFSKYKGQYAHNGEEAQLEIW